MRLHPAHWKAARAPIPFGLGLIGCLLVLALGGCGTFSGGKGDAGKRGGGYYLDDGPGDNPPANLDAIADAVPRAEPLHRGATRPYSVMGRSYTPMAELRPYRARGTATWYGRRYHGNRTASGEVYDMYAMTAAHPVLPIPSYVRVTNLGNGRAVVVRVNDRGPFLGERLIDLSYVAAHKLDLLREGSALVEVESVLPGSFAALASIPTEPLADAPPPPSATAASIAAAPTNPPANPDAGAPPGSFYLQLGAFSVRENAQRFLERMRVRLAPTEASLSIVIAGHWHRVHAGPYPSREAALQSAAVIAQMVGAEPVLVIPGAR
jgi:rare lipoprotein A